jgi:type II secretory pathway component PulC
MTSVWPSIVLRCAQLLFAGLILAALASAVSFGRTPPLDLAAPPSEISAAAEERPPLERFALIAQRNVFRASHSPVAISGTLPRTALDLELVGTLFAGEGRKWYSLALIKDARDQVTAVREGQSFVGGKIRLVSIEPRRVVIENAGAFEVLGLGSERDGSKPAPRADTAHGSEDAPDSANPYDTRMFEALRSNAQAPSPPDAAH